MGRPVENAGAVAQNPQGAVGAAAPVAVVARLHVDVRAEAVAKLRQPVKLDVGRVQLRGHVQPGGPVEPLRVEAGCYDQRRVRGGTGDSPNAR